MSISRKENVTCAKCQLNFEVTVWDSINTDLRPNLPQQVSTGDFFRYICPHCGFSGQVAYNTLYHDLKHHAMIWVVMRGSDYEEAVKAIRQTQVVPGFITRIVNSIFDLQEKVRILEAERDDRIIEIIKILTLGQVKEDKPDFHPIQMEYLIVGNQECIEVTDRDGRKAHVIIDESLYSNAEKTLKLILKLEPETHFDVINEEWALKSLDKLDKEIKRQVEAELLKKESPASEKATLYCRKCGVAITSDARFCYKCGTPVITMRQENCSERLTQQNREAPRNEPSGIVKDQIKTKSTVDKQKEKKKGKKGRIILLILGLTIVLNFNYLRATFFYDVTITRDSYVTLSIGETFEPAYSYSPSSISKSSFSWESSDESVVTVSSRGKMEGKNVGTAYVSILIDGVEKATWEVKVNREPVSVKNGEMIIKPKSTGNPEVTINAPKDENCFVYFENTRNSANDFAFYVKANSSVTVNAPAGTYNFYYATGTTWYGKDYKFGGETGFYKSPDIIELNEDRYSYDVLELTLYAVVNGNMDTDPIDASEFPI